MGGISRRSLLLRGMFGGATVAVGLPILDCLLDDGGTAWASGQALPVRFGTWFWGLGVTEDRWRPTKVGADYDITPELKPIERYKDKISILSGFDVMLDGRPNLPHQSGGVGFRTGIAPPGGGLPGPSFDVLIADQIGNGTRFRSLDVSASKDAGLSPLSGRGAGNVNPTESSPLAFYNRLFGPEFADPNSASFTPDPLTMARKSVLSSVTDERKDLERMVGASDRERLDQYFTALRQTEQQLAIQLEKPEPLAACRIPPKPPETVVGNQIEQVVSNHKVMAELLAMALACNQTRVFNLMFNNPASTLTKLGSSISHHQLTHEEPINPDLGYQPESTWFVERCMESWGAFVDLLGQFREGDSTLLDNSLIVAHSETNFAKTHTIEGLPVMLAGRAGGRIKTGLHIDGKSSTASRVGLTVQQAMGLQMEKFGAQSMETNKPISEIMV